MFLVFTEKQFACRHCYFVINIKQSKARIKITLNPLPLYEYIKLSMERMSSLSDTCGNTTNSKINRPISWFSFFYITIDKYGYSLLLL